MEKEKKKFSAFQIVSIILIAILIIAIIVQIGIMINLKHKINNTKEKNDEISQSIILNTDRNTGENFSIKFL